MDITPDIKEPFIRPTHQSAGWGRSPEIRAPRVICLLQRVPTGWEQLQLQLVWKTIFILKKKEKSFKISSFVYVQEAKKYKPLKQFSHIFFLIVRKKKTFKEPKQLKGFNCNPEPWIKTITKSCHLYLFFFNLNVVIKGIIYELSAA